MGHCMNVLMFFSIKLLLFVYRSLFSHCGNLQNFRSWSIPSGHCHI